MKLIDLVIYGPTEQEILLCYTDYFHSEDSRLEYRLELISATVLLDHIIS